MKSDSKAGRLLGVKGARFAAETNAQLFSRAQKELAAFVAAVTTLHGEEQARAAADDWLLEFIALKEPCNGAFLDLRSVTIGAAIRLALRFSIPSLAAIQISVRKKTSAQRRGKKLSPAQEKEQHDTLAGMPNCFDCDCRIPADSDVFTRERSLRRTPIKGLETLLSFTVRGPMDQVGPK